MGPLPGWHIGRDEPCWVLPDGQDVVMKQEQSLLCEMSLAPEKSYDWQQYS